MQWHKILGFSLLLVSLTVSAQVITTIHPTISQQAVNYLPKSLKGKRLWTQSQQHKMAKNYLSHFFAPWSHASAQQLQRIKQAENKLILSFEKQKTWGENFHPNALSWWQKIQSNMDLSAMGDINKAAILVQNSSLRALPTQLPAYHDYHRAGEGFPFDYLQNSSLWAGTPVRVIHTSRDGAWVLVITPWLYGWLPSQDVAYVSKTFEEHWRQDKFVVITKGHIPMRDTQGIFRFQGRLGAIYPLAFYGKDGYQVKIPVANMKRQAVIKTAAVHMFSAGEFPKAATYRKLAQQVQPFLNQPYGWGGLYGYRDCSETMRDYFAIFGHWLPRNSTAQIKTGHVVSLKGLSDKQKAKKIIQQGKPYATFLGHKGHVMLYIGEYQGIPVVFHTKWGLEYNNGSKGRAVIGKTALTTLAIGKHKAHTYSLYQQTKLMSLFSGSRLKKP